MTYGPDYDRYLDAERERRDAEGDAYVAWCEDNDKDPEGDYWNEWEEWVEDMRDDAAERAAEARREDMEFYDRYGDE
jgi:poly(3-hydroxyalkanoate) synthetase